MPATRNGISRRAGRTTRPLSSCRIGCFPGAGTVSPGDVESPGLSVKSHGWRRWARSRGRRGLDAPGLLAVVGQLGYLAQWQAPGGAAAREVAACRFQAARLLRPEDPQAVMLGEVLVVLEVQRGERRFVGEAAGRDPHVVDRAGAPASAGCCGQDSPDGGYCLIARQDWMPDSQLVPRGGGCPGGGSQPACQLTESHEGDEWFPADEARGQRSSELAPVQ